MQHDLGAVGQPPGAVTAQDDRELAGFDADAVSLTSFRATNRATMEIDLVCGAAGP
jgi:hypothetical protein